TIATTKHSSMSGLPIGERQPRSLTGSRKISACPVRCCSSGSRKRKPPRIPCRGDRRKTQKKLSKTPRALHKSRIIPANQKKLNTLDSPKTSIRALLEELL